MTDDRATTEKICGCVKSGRHDIAYHVHGDHPDPMAYPAGFRALAASLGHEFEEILSDGKLVVHCLCGKWGLHTPNDPHIDTAWINHVVDARVISILDYS